ncbi:MAG: hypothetical protein JXO22_02155 [Phycisphaerae bacterium]|nr:hypothetical protein [Phycisphaerae bacterium]
MKCQTSVIATVVCITLALAAGCAAGAPADIVAAPKSPEAVAYSFTPEDEALLDQVQYACFQYFWKEVGSPAKLAKDRHKGPVGSIASAGFQLSALPIGVERGWITREDGERRARTLLQALAAHDDNKRFGVYIHYPDIDTAGQSHEGYELLASTVDHALLMAGVITAGQYFGGQVRHMADVMIAETNWRAFAVEPQGYLSMGWTPDDPKKMDGPGTFHKAIWSWASDEELLVYFLAVGAPTPGYSVDPEMYYRLKRNVKQHKDMPPYVVSWGGPLFNYVFAHCWIDYRALGPDDPSKFRIDAPRVDWFENSRRAVLTHRQRCIEQAKRFKTFSENRWGLSACASHKGYLVPQVRPNGSDQDEWFNGTIAPYAAASALMFTPAESMAALHAFRELRGKDGKPLVWHDPSEGGYGFADSFNLDEQQASDDYVGIDQGPMLLGIENARSGLIWRLFMSDKNVQRAVKRLKLGDE